MNDAGSITRSRPSTLFALLTQKAASWRERLEWGRAHWLLLTLVVLSTALFWVTDWDIRIMRLFFDPAHPEAAWPLSKAQPWLFFYRAAPVLTLIPSISSLLVLFASRWHPRLRSWRRAALFIVLCIALGPGLTVNAICKDHWGRPRPRHVVELGGSQAYLPPLALGASDQLKSFPCGHSSVGFVYGAFFFILRKKRPRAAIAVLAGSLALGTLMGIGRMAAGAHFPSDVLWSAYLPLGIALLLSPMLVRHPVLAAPALLPAAIAPRMPGWELALWSLLMALFVGGALLAFPFQKSFRFEVPSQDLSAAGKALEVSAKNATLTLRVLPQPGYRLIIEGEGRGFGMPTNKLATDFARASDGSLYYGVAYHGVFTDIETRVTIEISRELLESGFAVYQRQGTSERQKVRSSIPAALAQAPR